MSTQDIANRLAYDMTPEALEAIGLDPIIPGEFYEHRAQALDIRGNPVDLTGAKIVTTVWQKDSTDANADKLLTRSSQVMIENWPMQEPAVPEDDETPQIEVDADQAAVTTDDETGDQTGKGWYTERFAPPDEDDLAPLLGKRLYYATRALFVDGEVKTLKRGRFALLYPRTQVADFDPPEEP